MCIFGGNITCNNVSFSECSIRNHMVSIDHINDDVNFNHLNWCLVTFSYEAIIFNFVTNKKFMKRGGCLRLGILWEYLRKNSAEKESSGCLWKAYKRRLKRNGGAIVRMKHDASIGNSSAPKNRQHVIHLFIQVYVTDSHSTHCP